MYINDGCIAWEVKDQICIVAKDNEDYIWTTEHSTGRELDILLAMRKATQQAVRETRKMIEIRSLFGDRKPVSEDEARRYIAGKLSRITTCSKMEEKAKLIDGKYLRGITVKELMNNNV